MKPGLQAVVAGLLAAGWLASARSQATEPTPSVYDILGKRAEADLTVPLSPAFALLGLAPTSIQRPGSVRELLASATKGFDANGKVKSGLALDFAPYPLLAPNRLVGGRKYETDHVAQVLARTTVSLATADANGGSQLAWGIRVGLLDQGDPGLYAKDLVACIRKSGALKDTMKGGANVDGLSDDEDAKLAAEVAKCAPDKQFALWAKPALYIGYGQSWYSGTSTLRDTAPAMKAFWATYSVGRSVASYRGLLQLHAERKTDDRVADKTDATKLLRQDSTSLVARLKLGAEKWHAYADLGRTRINLAGSPTTNSQYRGLGAEVRLKDDLWLQVGRSMERGLVDGSSQNKVLAGLRWGDKPLLEAPGTAAPAAAAPK